MKKIESTISNLKSLGFNISWGSEKKNPMNFIPTGSLLLDKAIGHRGYPSPRQIHLYGPPGSGKSLLACRAAAIVSNAGKGVIYCDVENNYQTEETNVYRTKQHMNLENVIDIPGTQSAEEIIKAVSQLMKADTYDFFRLIVVDSVSALCTNRFTEKEVSSKNVDDSPIIINRFCRDMNMINKSCAVLHIGHSMANIGSMGADSPKGGKGLQYFTKLRLEVVGRPSPEIKDEYGRSLTHEITRITVRKNQVANSGATIKDLLYDFRTGNLDIVSELVQLAEANGIIKRTGNFYQINGVDHKFQGQKKLRDFISENPEYFYWMFETVMGASYEEYFKIA